MNRELSKGWGGWTAMVAERAAALMLMRRGLSYLANRKLALALNTWVDTHSRVLEWRQRLMGRATGHMMHRGLSRGWGTWLESWQEAARRRAAVLEAGRKRQEEAHKRRVAYEREWLEARRSMPLGRSMANPLPRKSASCEFLARDATEARRIRAVAEVEENRRVEKLVRARSAAAWARRALQASESVPVLAQGALRPRSARGLSESASTGNLGAGGSLAGGGGNLPGGAGNLHHSVLLQPGQGEIFGTWER